MTSFDESNSVRVIDVFVDALDLAELGTFTAPAASLTPLPSVSVLPE